MAYPITKLWFYPFCRIFIRKIKGTENIPLNANFIIVSNHEKFIDPLYIIYPILRKLNKKVHFIATPRFWYFGETLCRKWAGCIPLFNTKKSYKEAKAVIKSGEIIGIFPEGHLKQKIRNPKTGAIRLALQTNTPILPVGLKSSYIPFNAKLNIGKIVYLRKNRDIRKQIGLLMGNIYNLRRGIS